MVEFETKDGVELSLTTISNIDIFTYLADYGLVIPIMPMSKLDDGRIVPNPHSPLYNDALMVYDVSRHNAALDGIISLCIDIVDTIPLKQYQRVFERMVAYGIDKGVDTLEHWYIKYVALTDIDDKARLTQLVLLTETLVSGIFNSIRVTRGGDDIHKVHLKNAIRTDIQYDNIVIAGQQLVSPSDEASACIWSLLSRIDWNKGKYSLKEKATTIALYRLNKVVETHNNDVVQIHQEKESRKNKPKR